jgi:tRNA U54 and U55 pseudouridine synthase Pus10
MYWIRKNRKFIRTVNYIDPKAEKKEMECLLCNDVIYDYYEPTFSNEICDFINQYYLKLFENGSQLPKGAYYIILDFYCF